MPELFDEGIVTLKAGDALKDSAVDQYEPFDAIHVGASAGHVPKVCTVAELLTQSTIYHIDLAM